MEKESSALKQFFLPKFTWKFWVRLLIVAGTAYVVFGYFLLPCVVAGASMEPTYASNGINFCIREKNAGDRVDYGDVVIIRNRERSFYLKRVIGKPGDTIEFVRGQLYRNGQKVNEPYVKNPCDWDLAPEHVDDGMLYVVGDNRSMPSREHRKGLVDKERVIGEPLW